MRVSRRATVAASMSIVFLLAGGGVASAPAAVSVANSGWAWGNPVPQGNDIRALEFLGNRGYAGGTFGTLLRTDDGGSTWSGIATGINQDLTRIRIIDGDSVVVAAGCAVRRSDDAGQTFNRLPWTASDLNCPSPIAALSFPGDRVGYLATTNGGVFRTDDGGQTWSRKTAVPAAPTGAAPADLSFTAPDVGVAVTAGGRVYRTTDGASSWTLVAALSQGLTALHFVDASTGYVVGNGNSVLKTVDGGANWTIKATGGSFPMTSVRCADATSCLITVDGGDRLLRTTDGADSFTSVTPSTEKIFAAAFVTPTRAVAAGQRGATVVSNDTGATWSKIGSALAATLTRLRATSATLAFAPGRDGALARTTDGGSSWTLLGVSTSQDVLDASFPTEGVGFALDTAGAVLKTTNGGSSWQILNTGTSVRPAAILALDPNRILLIGPRGIRRSTDGGGTFASVRGAIRKAPLQNFDRAGSVVFVRGQNALFASRNGGKSWKKVGRPTRKTNLVSVDFVTSRLGFALTLDGRLWQTRNGGRRWRELPGVGSADGMALAFGSSKRGYLTLSQFGRAFRGYVLRTTDGGRTWRPQLVDDAQSQHDGIAATGADTALLLADDSSLFTTTTGGDAGKPSSLTLKASKLKLRKRQTVKITGRLMPAEGGEQLVVSIRSVGGGRWVHRSLTVASNGTFTTSWKVKTSTYFVAQWTGDDDRMADGSKLLTVKLGRR